MTTATDPQVGMADDVIVGRTPVAMADTPDDMEDIVIGGGIKED